MTLADILEPAAVVLTHAEARGLRIGAGAGAVVCAPLLYIKPSLVNVQDDPPLVAIAKCAGTGAVIGSVVAGGICIAKLVSGGKDCICTRAEALRNNEEQKQLDKIAAAGAVTGLGLVALRFSKIAEAENVKFIDVARTKSSCWESFCFSVLGAAVAVGAVTGGKALHRAINNVMETAAQNGEDAVKEATAAVDEAVSDAAAVAETKAEEAESKPAEVEKKASEIVDDVKSSIQPPSQ